MGNLCSKSDSGDNFSQPGRTLGAAPEQPSRASVPASAGIPGGGGGGGAAAARKVGGPPRTLGGGDASGADGGGAADDARRRAAEAAEARANAANRSTGKLGAQLNEQRKQTRNELLQEISHSNVRQRDADEAADARIHN